jgi:hypothetical protein
VTNFEKRQAAMTEAERAARYRQHKRSASPGAAAVTSSDAAAVTDSYSYSASPSPLSGEGEGVQGKGEGAAPHALLSRRRVSRTPGADAGRLVRKPAGGASRQLSAAPGLRGPAYSSMFSRK